jgi:polyferredoxin
MKDRLTAKQIKLIHRRLRAAIQLFYFLLFPSAFTAAFAGIKYIAIQLGSGAIVEWTAFVAVLTGLCLYTVLFGRFFCGFACAFGSFGDAVHTVYVWICKKWKKKPVSIPSEWGRRLSGVKYAVLALIVLLCFGGVYSNLRGTSPWDVFSMLHAGNFRLSGYIPGVVILLLLIPGMCVQERFFCRFLCPMGAVFSILPVFPVFALRRDREHCIKGCSACTRVCPSQVELAEEGSLETAGDCFQCQKCIDTCPKKNIHCGCGKIRGNEIWFTALRVILLLVLYRMIDL